MLCMAAVYIITKFGAIAMCINDYYQTCYSTYTVFWCVRRKIFRLATQVTIEDMI